MRRRRNEFWVILQKQADPSLDAWLNQSANPQLHGIVLDLPEVVPSATAAAAMLGLAERSRVLAGDFFASVPEADLYLLKHILHDWDDARAVRILENCRRAMRSGGRIIVIEMLLGEIGDRGLLHSATST